MALFPNTKDGKIGFFNSKLAPWTTSATAIGTTSAAVTSLGTLVATATTKVAAQLAAESAARTATADADNAVAQMVAAGMDIVKNIRAKAANAADPQTVYSLAQIPAPATPSPITELGTPTDFVVTLSASGALKLKWKCTNPLGASGTLYQIWRRISPSTQFVYIGGVGTKKFEDATVPAGSSQVTYQIQAARSTAVGEWAQFNVNFGVDSGGGMMVASITEGTPAKIAA